MKKIITTLLAIAFTTTSTATVVACNSPKEDYIGSSVYPLKESSLKDGLAMSKINEPAMLTAEQVTQELKNKTVIIPWDASNQAQSDNQIIWSTWKQVNNFFSNDLWAVSLQVTQKQTLSNDGLEKTAPVNVKITVRSFQQQMSTSANTTLNVAKGATLAELKKRLLNTKVSVPLNQPTNIANPLFWQELKKQLRLKNPGLTVYDSNCVYPLDLGKTINPNQTYKLPYFVIVPQLAPKPPQWNIVITVNTNH